MKSIILMVTLLMPTLASATCGAASWYKHGKVTANGEKFNPSGLTAAHKSLPFGTKLKVTYKNKNVVVRVNDRGPFAKGRILDLSQGAARRLGITKKGVATVCFGKVK